MGDRRIRAMNGALKTWGRLAALMVAMLLAVAGRTAAQTESGTGLASLLPELILREIRLPMPAGGLSHSAHFSPFTVADLTNPAVAIVGSFNQQMVIQLSTFPIGSSAGGFSYKFDPALGTFRRASTSFGPLFAERAATIGRGRFSAGFNYQHSSYTRFEGSNLDDGSIKFYLRHQDCCTTGSGPAVPPSFGVETHPDGTLLNPFFEGDVIETALSLNVATDMVALFGNYGLTDRWDVSLAVPFVHVDMDASVLATIQRLATALTPQIHSFESGNPQAISSTFSSGGSATGLGDIAVRSKYRIFDLPTGGLAAAMDLRLPTGDEKDLLGGTTQIKVMAVESAGNDRIAQHVNIGYTFASEGSSSSDSDPLTTNFPDEFNYAFGVEFVANPRVTIIGDVVGRTLIDAGRLVLTSKTFQFQPPGNPAPPIASMQFDEFEPRPGNLNLVYGTAGVKINAVGNTLFSVSVLFPLNDSGLKSGVTTVFGMDYAF